MTLQEQEETRTVLALRLWGRELVVRDPGLKLRILKESESRDVCMTLEDWWVSRIP